MDQTANTEIVLQQKKGTFKVAYNQNDNRVVGVKYEYKTNSGKNTADLNDASTNPTIRKQFSQSIEVALQENKTLAADQRRSENEVQVLNAAKQTYGYKA